MLRLSKVCVWGIPIGLTLVALSLAGGITSVQAAPMCGNTIELGNGGTVLFSQITTGTCVQAGDKLFGTFNLRNLPTTGALNFNATNPNHVSASLQDTFVDLNTYDYSWEVEVSPAGPSITALTADITQTLGGPTTLMETTTPAGGGPGIDLVKNGGILTGPDTILFTPGVGDIEVTSAFHLGPGSDASAALNTIVETTPVPEPATLELLGIALTGFGAFGLRRRGRCGDRIRR